MIELDTRQEEATKEEPPKKWRNWWLSREAKGHVVAARCGLCGANLPVHSGAHADHCITFDNREAAERDAQIWMKKPNQCAWYLGAFSEDERPDV